MFKQESLAGGQQTNRQSKTSNHAGTLSNEKFQGEMKSDEPISIESKAASKKQG